MGLRLKDILGFVPSTLKPLYIDPNILESPHESKYTIRGLFRDCDGSFLITTYGLRSALCPAADLSTWLSANSQYDRVARPDLGGSASERERERGRAAGTGTLFA